MYIHSTIHVCTCITLLTAQLLGLMKLMVGLTRSGRTTSSLQREDQFLVKSPQGSLPSALHPAGTGRCHLHTMQSRNSWMPSPISSPLKRHWPLWGTHYNLSLAPIIKTPLIKWEHLRVDIVCLYPKILEWACVYILIPHTCTYVYVENHVHSTLAERIQKRKPPHKAYNIYTRQDTERMYMPIQSRMYVYLYTFLICLGCLSSSDTSNIATVPCTCNSMYTYTCTSTGLHYIVSQWIWVYMYFTQ